MLPIYTKEEITKHKETLASIPKDDDLKYIPLEFEPGDRVFVPKTVKLKRSIINECIKFHEGINVKRVFKVEKANVIIMPESLSYENYFEYYKDCGSYYLPALDKVMMSSHPYLSYNSLNKIVALSSRFTGTRDIYEPLFNAGLLDGLEYSRPNKVFLGQGNWATHTIIDSKNQEYYNCYDNYPKVVIEEVQKEIDFKECDWIKNNFAAMDKEFYLHIHDNLHAGTPVRLYHEYAVKGRMYEDTLGDKPSGKEFNLEGIKDYFRSKDSSNHVLAVEILKSINVEECMLDLLLFYRFEHYPMQAKHTFYDMFWSQNPKWRKRVPSPDKFMPGVATAFAYWNFWDWTLRHLTDISEAEYVEYFYDKLMNHRLMAKPTHLSEQAISESDWTYISEFKELHAMSRFKALCERLDIWKHVDQDLYKYMVTFDHERKLRRKNGEKIYT